MKDEDMNLNINDNICPNCEIELESGVCSECGFIFDEPEKDDFEENRFDLDEKE